MKRWPYTILISFVLISCTVIGYVVYHYYASPAEQQSYPIPIHHDDTLRIAYIGDSWAAIHKDHHCIIPQMLSDSIHRPVKLSSFGLHGKTSKEIYESLFTHQQIHDFMMQGYDYCFISAGINDTYKKMRTIYYQTSMDYIIRFMLANKIQPIILEIPDYDIFLSYERQKSSRKIARRISSLLTGTSMDCKQEFRNTLMTLINERHYQGSIILLPYKAWNYHYSTDLKLYYQSDGMHLNQNGYLRLDSCITSYILKDMRHS